MLVLSRKRHESVVIDGTAGIQQLLKVTVLDIVGRRVRLGFELDAGIPVHRLEVWERIQASDRRDGPTEDPVASGTT